MVAAAAEAVVAAAAAGIWWEDPQWPTRWERGAPVPAASEPQEECRPAVAPKRSPGAQITLLNHNNNRNALLHLQ